MWETWHHRGLAHANLSRLKAAIDDQTRALELNPKYCWTWWARGNAYRRLKQWDKALADYERAVETSRDLPHLPTMCFAKATALAQLNRPDEAMAELKKATALGFRETNALRRDEGLAPIRERDDFQALLRELEAKKK